MASESNDVNMTDANGADNIDEGLYSRQLYVFGKEAQAKMGSVSVLVVGLRGLGVEVAKNIILAGVKSVGLLDNRPAELRDLGAQFYLSAADVGKARAPSSLDMLRGLNKYVDTHVVAESEAPGIELSEELVRKYQVLVLTDHTFDEISRWSTFCHANGVKLVAANVHGLFASCFVDVGEAHMVSDKDGERPSRGLIINVTKANPGVVTVHEDKRHNMETGDWVQFEEVEGMTELNSAEPQQIKVLNPFSFEIADTSSFGEYTGEGYFNQVKVPVQISHVDMPAAVEQAMSKVVFDIYGHSHQLLSLHAGLSKFAAENGGNMPAPDQPEQAARVVALAKEFAAARDIEVNDALLTGLARCAGAQISPMCAMMGGMAAQEVLKASSGKFTPLDQFFYFDASTALPKELNPAECAPQGTRYDDQVAIFGAALSRRVQELNLFLIGSGAIGCEMLKNWALMGVATAGNGRIHVTDMDSIERSNLNRQFLFRPSDVGQNKSTAAAAAVRAMNGDLRIEPAQNKVGPDTESIYNDAFWEGLDAAVTALDNVEARLYVDQRCIFFQKAMIDSGTLGTKGNTQVVVPFATESYGSSRDPPEESIPICTLKNFPNKIEHTIQWARDNFEGLFAQAPAEVNNYLSNPNYMSEIAKQPNQQLDALRTIKKMLVTEKPVTFEACIVWARLLFESEYNHKIRQLLHAFPEDSLTSAGTRFWSGTKRAPNPVEFDPNDPLHLNFVVAAANLHAFNYGLTGSTDVEEIRRIVANVEVPDFQPANVKIAANDEEAKALAEDIEDDHDQLVEDLVAALPSPSSLAGLKLEPVEFEKDDDSNFHMDFITACSNLRARNYRIKEANKLQTKFIAGKIIPAIATTTALVTGLVCLELYKVLQQKELEDYRNTYVNLALPLVTQSEPQAPTFETANLKTGEWRWSLWDRINIDLGSDVTLQQFIDYMESHYGLEVSMISCGSSMIYYSFGAMKKKVAERLAMPLTQVVQTVSKTDLPPDTRYLVLEAVVANIETDEDVEIPQILVKI